MVFYNPGKAQKRYTKRRIKGGGKTDGRIHGSARTWWSQEVVCIVEFRKRRVAGAMEPIIIRPKQFFPGGKPISRLAKLRGNDSSTEKERQKLPQGQKVLLNKAIQE